MTTREAIEHILKETGLTKYALAQSLGASPVSINQWLRRTKMSTHFALKVLEKYGILIQDD